MTLLIFLLTVFFFVFLIGLCFGSFLNVVILRAFSNESIAFPGSKCPSCQTPLKWYHNIPVLSYLFLKGKCAFCKDTISVQYPIIELVTALMFVAVVFKFGFGLDAIFMLIFTCLFIVLAVTDIKEKVVFDAHTYTLIISGLIFNLFNIGHITMGKIPFAIGGLHFAINNSFISSILGLIAGVVIMEIFARFGYLVAGTRAFGEGDSYIAAGLGAIFGINHLVTVLAYGFIIQIVLTLPIFIKKLYTNKDYKTLGSFLLFFFLIILIKVLDYADLMNNLIVFTIFTLILCFVGFYLCKRILGGLKEAQNMTYLPFGPAMVFGGFIMMFLLDTATQLAP